MASGLSLPPFVRQVSETLGIRVLAILTGLLISVLVARSLGPEGRGLFAVALTLAGMGVQFGNLGLHASNTYYLAQSPPLLAPLMGNSAVAAWAIGGGGALLGWLVLSLVPHLSPLPQPTLMLAFLWIPIGLTNLYGLNLLLASGDVRSYNRLELAAKLLTLGFIGSAVLGGHSSPEAFVLSNVLALAVTAKWGWNRLKQTLSASPRPDWRILRQHLPYGLKAYTAALASFVALKSDMLWVHHLSGPKGAGLYAIVVTLSEFILLTPTLTGALLFPRLAALQDPAETWRHTRKALLGVGAVLLTLIAILAVIGGGLIHLLFGQPFVPASQALVWHLPGLLFLGLQIVLAQFLAATGLSWTITLVWGLAWLINLALNIVLIPNMGFQGASLAFTCTQLAVLLGISTLVIQQRMKNGPLAA